MISWNDFWSKMFMALAVPGFSFDAPRPYVLNVASNVAAFARVGDIMSAVFRRESAAP